MKGPQNFAALNPRSVSSQNLRQNVCGGTELGEVIIITTSLLIRKRLKFKGKIITNDIKFRVTNFF